MKKLFLLLFMACMAGGAVAQHKTTIQIAGPEESYNLVRVTNQSRYSDFEGKIFFLENQEGKMVTGSMLGLFRIKGYDDSDSFKVRTHAGQHIGVVLPEQMSDVSVNVVYHNYPLFDIVQILLTDKTDDVKTGQEF